MKPEAPMVSLSPPAAREDGSLLIVTRNKPGLYEYVKRLVAKYPRIQVMIDRRRVRRRRVKGAPAFDRRTKDRRTRPEADEEVRVQGWAAVAPGHGDG